MDIRDTIKATNTAIATVDLVKDYGSGNNTVHALRGVNVAFEKGKFLESPEPKKVKKANLCSFGRKRCPPLFFGTTQASA